MTRTIPAPLLGKVALVTGAGRGIGRGIAHELAGQGADLALVDVSADVLAEVAAEMSGRSIPVVDSAEATAAAVLAWIDDEKITPASTLPAPGSELELLVTDLPKSFAAMAEQMLGTSAPHVTQVDLTA